LGARFRSNVAWITRPKVGAKTSASGAIFPVQLAFFFAHREERLGALGGDDAGDAGKVGGDAKVGPVGGLEERLDGGETVVAEFEDQDAAGSQASGSLQDEGTVEFGAFFAAVECQWGFVLADIARQSVRFAAPDVGRVADDEIERWRRAAGGA
jgi:hypothetical protein